MKRSEALETVKREVKCTDFLQKSKHGKYICPFCGSGTGVNKSGALEYYADSNKTCCFAGCGKKSYDVLDIYGNIKGLDFNESLKALCDSLNITLEYDDMSNFKTAGEQKHTDGQKTPRIENNNATEAVGEEKTTSDYRKYYAECENRLFQAKSYLIGRGISLETARDYQLGFDPEWKSPTNKKIWPSSRLIIPCSKNCYVARATDAANTIRYMNETGGGDVSLFNEAALYGDHAAVFITEGAFDALSLLELGFFAVALNSISNYKKLAEKLKLKPTAATLIISLDNDKSGRETAEKLHHELTQINTSWTIANVAGECNDINEALQKDREALRTAAAVAVTEATKPDSTLSYLFKGLQQDIKNTQDGKKTGFGELDKISGGINAGLYILAAMSSLGKTTFAINLADNLAAEGEDIIFFSLEMSKLELVTKSLARVIAENGKYRIDDKKKKIGISSLDLRRGYYSNDLQQAIKDYSAKVGNHFNVVEGNFNCDVERIGNYIRTYCERNNRKPIVIIDYLQIMQPTKEYMHSDAKSIVDSIVVALKRLSRELDITILAICSINRSNYTLPLAFESLKESGTIEYTADVVWGLQPSCVRKFAEKETEVKKREKVNAAKKADVRELDLVCLKNRYGVASYRVDFLYHADIDKFVGKDADGFTDVGSWYQKRVKGLSVSSEFKKIV